MSDEKKPGDGHECCWHPVGTQQLTYPPRDVRVCCHCGTQKSFAAPQPPIPDGHGKHYPRPMRFG